MQKIFTWNYKRTKEYKIKSFQKKAAWLALFFFFFQFISPFDVRAGDTSGLSFSPGLQATVSQSVISSFGVDFNTDGNSILDPATVNHTNVNIRNYFGNGLAISTGVTYDLNTLKVSFSLPSGTLPIGTYYYYIRGGTDGVKFADGSNFPVGWGSNETEKSLHYFSVSSQNLSAMTFLPARGGSIPEYTSSYINIQDDGPSKLMNSTVTHESVRIRRISDDAVVSTGASYDTNSNQVKISVPGGLPTGQYYYYLASSLMHIEGLKYEDGSAFPLGFGVAEKQNNKFTIVGSNTLTTAVDPVEAGSVAKNPNQATYADGTNVSLTATPSDGYSFTNWTGDCSGQSSSTYVVMSSDKTCTANFTQSLVSVATMTKDSPSPSEVFQPGEQISFVINASISPASDIRTFIKYAPTSSNVWTHECGLEVDFQPSPITRTCSMVAPGLGSYKWVVQVQESTSGDIYTSDISYFSVSENVASPEFDLTEVDYTHTDSETGLRFVMYDFPLGVTGVNIEVTRILESQHTSSVSTGREIKASYDITATDQNGAPVTEDMTLNISIPYPSSQDSLEEGYTVMYWAGSFFSSFGTYGVDVEPENNVVRFVTTHLTEFVVTGDIADANGDIGEPAEDNLVGSIAKSGINIMNLFGLNLLLAIALMFLMSSVIGRTRFAYLVK